MKTHLILIAMLVVICSDLPLVPQERRYLIKKPEGRQTFARFMAWSHAPISFFISLFNKTVASTRSTI